MIDWQPAETAPRNGKQILARNNRGNHAVVIWQRMINGEEGWVVMFSDGRLHPFWNGDMGSVMTHWAELS